MQFSLLFKERLMLKNIGSFNLADFFSRIVLCILLFGSAPQLSIGDRVVRGPDWLWGDQVRLFICSPPRS